MGFLSPRWILIFLLLLFVGCQNSGKVLQIYSYWRDPGIQDTFWSLVEAFQAENAGIEVAIHTLDDGEFQLRLAQWLTTDRGPDLITWTGGRRLADLDQRMNLASLDHLFTEKKPQDVFSGRFLKPSQVQGSLKLLPLSWYWWGVYYRPTVLRSLGISRVPQDWKEMESLAEAVKAQGRTPFLLGLKGIPWALGSWLDYLNLRSHGLEFQKKFLAGEISLDDPRIRQTLRTLKKIKDNLWFNPDYETITLDEAQDRLLDGQGAFMLQSQTIHEHQKPGQDLDFFAFPAWDSQAAQAEGSAAELAPIDGLVKAPRAPQSALADRFLEFLMRPENIQKWSQTQGRNTTSRDADPPDLLSRKGLRQVLSAPVTLQHFDRETPIDFAFPFLDYLMDYMAGRLSEKEAFTALETLRRGVFNK